MCHGLYMLQEMQRGLSCYRPCSPLRRKDTFYTMTFLLSMGTSPLETEDLCGAAGKGCTRELTLELVLENKSQFAR